MRLSRLEKRLLALLMVIALVLGFTPSVTNAETEAEAETKEEFVLYDSNDSGFDYSSSMTIFPKGAVEKEVGDFYYKVDDAGNAVITRYKGSTGNVTVPSQIDGKTVVSIYAAFYGNTTVTNVTLPSTVTKIEYGAFCRAVNLRSINLENVKYLGMGYFDSYDLNFESCQKLNDIVLPDNIVIYGRQFTDSKLNSLTIPRTIVPENIYANTYYRLCLGELEVGEVKFAEGTTKVELNFRGLKTPQLVFPDSVTDLSESRFYGVETNKIVCGSGLKRVGARQFSSIKDTTVDLGSVQVIEGEAFYDSQLTALVIPNSVTEIQYRAFYESRSLSNVAFSTNLTKIVGGYEGFMYDTAWYNNQNKGLIYTGGALYCYKGSIPKNSTIDVRTGTKGIGYGAFQTPDASNANISRVTLPDGLLYIGGISFFNTGISEIAIPETVTEIGPGAFGNTGLKSVYIPKSVTKIGQFALGYENEDLRDNGRVWIFDDLIQQGYIPNDQLKYGEDRRWRYHFNMQKWDLADFFGICDVLDWEGNVVQEAYQASKVDGFTIVGYKGSAAEKYAKANGFTFVPCDKAGWQSAGGQWFYITGSHTLQTGWKQIGGKWYFFKANGAMASNEYCGGFWLNKNGTWTYKAEASWKKVAKGWSYGDTKGWSAKNSWLKIDDEWYYFNADGVAQTGWAQIGGKWYFFKNSGAMAANEYCKGYWLNADGTWTYKAKASWKSGEEGWWYGDTRGWYAKSTTIVIDGKAYSFNAKGICSNP